MDMLELLDASKPNHPVFTNGSLNRSAEAYLKVTRQFEVMTNPRYEQREVARPGIKETFCNIFVWDVTRAMACEIPHWFNNYAKMPDGVVRALGKENNANATIEWLSSKWGPLYGWNKLPSRQSAALRANSGYPTVVTWYNPTGTGHVAMGVPNVTNTGTLLITQAGAVNVEEVAVEEGFGNNGPLFFYTHD